MLKTRVLIVEDEPSVRNVCEAILRQHGFDPIVETEGLAGLQTFKEKQEEICLVLSDVSMPNMDGIEMARLLFEFYSHPNVLLMTGHRADSVPEDLRRLCSVIQKPFTSNQLIAAIKKCLDYEEQLLLASGQDSILPNDCTVIASNPSDIAYTPAQ